MGNWQQRNTSQAQAPPPCHCQVGMQAHLQTSPISTGLAHCTCRYKHLDSSSSSTFSCPPYRQPNPLCCCSSTSKPTASDTIYEALLDWADTGDASLRPVAVQQHPKYGRCLVASQDIPNGTVLLSVPLEKVFQSQVRNWAFGSVTRVQPDSS